MPIRDQLATDLKESLKSGDNVRLRTVRSIVAAVKQAEIDGRPSKTAVSESDVLAIISKQAKQRRDSIEQFEAGGRDDLARNEKDELAIIESYLPPQLGEAEVQAVVNSIAERLDANDMKAFGKVMGEAMSELRGQADGKLVQAAVRKRLSN